MKQVANGFDYKVGTFDKYDINGYRFRTHGNEERRDVLKSRNTGVSAICNGVEYYGRVDEIYELHYYGVANNIEFHNKAERVFAELWVIIKFPSDTASPPSCSSKTSSR